jgi:hypothetical protein
MRLRTGSSPFTSRILKKSSSFVPTGHCRLTISAAFTDVPYLIRHGVNLSSSTDESRQSGSGCWSDTLNCRLIYRAVIPDDSATRIKSEVVRTPSLRVMLAL